MDAIDVGVRLPEAIAVGADGQLWVGSDDGWIYRVDGGETTPVIDLGGLSIGLGYVEASGLLWSATYGIGLQRIDLSGAHPTVRIVHPHPFPEDVLALPDGRVFFTTASESLTPATLPGNAPITEWNLIDSQPSGRLLSTSATGRDVRVLATGLAFPSGLALEGGGKALLVVELAARRIMRFPLTAPAEPSVFAEDLPGLPDDISGTGPYWVTLPAPAPRLLSWLRASPPLAAIYRRLPFDWQKSLLTPPADEGALLLLGNDGSVHCRVTFVDTAFSLIANVVAQGEVLVLGALAGETIFEVTLPVDCRVPGASRKAPSNRMAAQ